MPNQHSCETAFFVSQSQLLVLFWVAFAILRLKHTCEKTSESQI